MSNAPHFVQIFLSLRSFGLQNFFISIAFSFQLSPLSILTFILSSTILIFLLFVQ